MESLFECEICCKSFKHKHSLKQHMLALHKGIKFPCEKCEKIFTRKTNLNKHLCVGLPTPIRKHNKCVICEKNFSRIDSLKRHLKCCKNHEKNRKGLSYSVCKTCNRITLIKDKGNCFDCTEFGKMCFVCKRCIIPFDSHDSKCKSCFNKSKKNKQKGIVGQLVDSLTINNATQGDLKYIVRSNKSEIINFITYNKLTRRGIKIVVCVSILFSKMRNGEQIFQTSHLRTSPINVLPHNDSDIIDYIISSIKNKMETYTSEGSNWKFEMVKIINVDVATYNPHITHL